MGEAVTRNTWRESRELVTSRGVVVGGDVMSVEHDQPAVVVDGDRLRSVQSGADQHLARASVGRHQLHAAVGAVGDDDVVGGVNAHAGGTHQLSGLRALAAEAEQTARGAIVDGERVPREVGDDDVVVRVDGHVLRPHEPGRPHAVLHEAVAVVHVHAAGSLVGDEHLPARRHRHAVRLHHMRQAGEAAHVAAVVGEDLHLAGGRVADDHPAARQQGDVPRPAQAAGRQLGRLLAEPAEQLDARLGLVDHGRAPAAGDGQSGAAAHRLRIAPDAEGGDDARAVRRRRRRRHSHDGQQRARCTAPSVARGRGARRCQSLEGAAHGAASRQRAR